MKPKKRRMQIRQRQLRRKKNVSFRRLSFSDRSAAEHQQRDAITSKWLDHSGKMPIDNRSLREVERWQCISFWELVPKIIARFPEEKIQVLDEGAGMSSLKQGLQSDYGKKLQVTTTDVRAGVMPGARANVLELSEKLGKNRFHLVVSTYGGAIYTPLPEKAFFQIVSVLKPGGIGIINTKLQEERLGQLAKRLRISINEKYGDTIVFTKNFARGKGK